MNYSQNPSGIVPLGDLTTVLTDSTFWRSKGNLLEFKTSPFVIYPAVPHMTRLPDNSSPGRYRVNTAMELGHLHRPWSVGLFWGLLLMLFLVLLEVWFASSARDGLYYHEMSSERMMQTVSIRDLKDQPLLSLWNIHIQPPGFDSIRAALALLWKSAAQNDYELLKRVDSSIYALWIVVYGFAGFIMFQWISEMTNVRFGVCATILFLIHPACIYYVTFLDTTFLSATLVLLLYYLLWRLKQHKGVPTIVLALSFLALFLTRSLFQWPFLLVLGGSLALMKVPSRKIVLFFVLTGIAVGFYTGKQAYQFGLTSTSSFMGFNLLRSIGLRPDYAGVVKNFPTEDAPGADKAMVLTRKEKIDGSVNFNNEFYLDINEALLQEYFRRLYATPFSPIFKEYWKNLGFYFCPSRGHSRHVIVDRLPWRSVYDFIFSAPVLPVLLVLSFVFWMANRRGAACASSVGFCIPVVTIAALSVLCDQGENARLKFFIEPVIFVFLATNLHDGAILLCRRFGLASL